MKKIHYLKLIISILIPLFAGFLGSMFIEATRSEWFLSLQKPFFYPPNWLFAPVWTILYIMIGLSFYLIWINKSKNKKPLYWLFGIQMILNVLWTSLFFGLKSILTAYIEIILLWIAILLMIIKYYKISKASSYLLIPYILWVTFASFLNLFILILN